MKVLLLLLLVMTIVNCCVVDKANHKVLLKWKIIKCETQNTVAEFFGVICQQHLEVEVDSLTVEAAYIGRSKEALDSTDLDIDLGEVISTFGSFLKYEVKSKATQVKSTSSSVSAFAIMMAAQREECRGRLPDKLEKDTLTRKEKLYNDVIDLLEKYNLSWKGRDATNSYGVRLVKVLVECLWYLDGRYQIFIKQGYPIPQIFTSFTGYNVPEASKHRKRSLDNMAATTLRDHSTSLLSCLQSTYWKEPMFVSFKKEIELLTESLLGYQDYLESQNKKIRLSHNSCVPIRKISESISIEIIKRKQFIAPCHKSLSVALSQAEAYQHLSVGEFCPSDVQCRYRYMQRLKSGLNVPFVLLTYSPGNNMGNLYFVWNFESSDTIETVFQKSLPVVDTIKSLLPQYHTRAMRKALLSKYGCITSKIQPALLRQFYRDLTGDCSSASNLSEKEIDLRVAHIIDMEPSDPSTVFDLRSLNSSSDRKKYDVFWECCSKYLNESIGTAVDDRRHSDVVHLAQAISIRDLRDEVQKKCPEGTSIPSLEWIRLQFWPKSKRSSSIHYTGVLKIKFMVQKRQWRKEHCDAHYGAAVFRYLRELAIKFCEYTGFVCLDDKHKIKIGEPGYPLAAAERGRRVVVSATKTFEVGDHDFSKVSVIPSVSLLVDVPADISESWYSGRVNVCLKESAFQPSSPLRHMSELHKILTQANFDKPILCIYTDGGPDHRTTYVSVKLSLIALYLKLDLDYLIAARTPPYHSWRNPVERAMSLLNLGLQCVGMMRREGSESFEREMAQCGNMKAIRKAGDKREGFKGDLEDSVEPVKGLLSQIFQRLKLKEKDVNCISPATDTEITEMWEELKSIDPGCGDPQSLKTKSAVTENPILSQFFSHCCRERHYYFEIKKCGKDECHICRPVRLASSVFQNIHHFPDPVPADNDHYKSFSDIYGHNTTEEHRPSLKKRSSKEKTLPFHGKLQHVKNANLMLECEECGMWRLIYAKTKLTKAQSDNLQAALEGMSFSCGAPLQELELPSDLIDTVFVRNLNCHEPIEALYYSAKYEPICVYCAKPQGFTDDKQYPQCSDCKDKPVVTKR
ncbi:uncharacterized protein [Dysidea avara]|uniref:uncharacterized protein n=1 Tax=Dysidea avara TaxID=196820 RepID=UPI0033307110